MKAILFDMDGVLIDSEALMAKSGILALRDYGIDPVPEDFIPFVGRGEDKYIGGVAQKYGLTYTPEMKSRAYEYYGQYVEDEAAVPGDVKRVLTAIKDRGYKIAVCTSADYAKVVHNLRAIGLAEDFFDAFVTGDNIKNLKPHPEIYLTGAALTGTKPEDCLVVEDAPSGILAAHAGGMVAVGIDSSFPEAYLTEQIHPDYIIHSLSELLDILDRYEGESPAAPSLDAWLKEAKASPDAPRIGMFLAHNGVVREDARARVREGDGDAAPVRGMRFSHDEAKVRRAVEETLALPGVYHARAWLNEGMLKVGDDIMLVLIGADIRPHAVDALQFLVGKLKGECVTEKEIY